MPNDNSYVRKRNLFDPRSKTPFKLSRSRLENFLSCPRCFYMDRRLGVEPPGIPTFTLNNAVDELLKREFDQYRRRQEAHPLMKEYGINAVPFLHPKMDEWRETFKGVQCHHKATNMIVFGAVDDIWVDDSKTLYVVDYKATSTSGEITLETEYRQAFKRQMEIYQWLLRKQDLTVSDTGYFLYCNARKDTDAFSSLLKFETIILPYQGRDEWIESSIRQAHECLMKEALPEPNPDCGYCRYRQAAGDLEGRQGRKTPAQQELFS